jgi:hypothetical protein
MNGHVETNQKCPRISFLLTLPFPFSNSNLLPFSRYTYRITYQNSKSHIRRCTEAETDEGKHARFEDLTTVVNDWYLLGLTLSVGSQPTLGRNMSLPASWSKNKARKQHEVGRKYNMFSPKRRLTSVLTDYPALYLLRQNASR